MAQPACRSGRHAGAWTWTPAPGAMAWLPGAELPWPTPSREALGDPAMGVFQEHLVKASTRGGFSSPGPQVRHVEEHYLLK